MKKQMICLAILCSLLTSCATKPIPPFIKDKFTNRFVEGGNRAREKININGYYVMYYNSTIPVNMIFFDDNTFAGSFFFEETFSEVDIQQNLKKSVVQTDNIHVGYWGIYKIQGDTIIIQYLSRASLLAPWVFIEETYQILNDTTLQLVFKEDLIDSVMTYSVTNESSIQEVRYSLAHFHKADSLFSSNNWLKEEKWLWENEDNWQIYMKRKTLK